MPYIEGDLTPQFLQSYTAMLTAILGLLTSPSLVVFAITLFVVHGIKRWLSHPWNLPPMPCLPIPILGHTLLMIPSFAIALQKWKKKAGDIFTIYHGRSPSVVICSYDLLNEAFVKKADIFSDRPYDFRKKVSPELSSGIVMNSGASWKEQRTLAMAILRDFGMGKNSLAEKISDEVRAYIKVLEDWNGEPKDVSLLTNTAIANVICSILLGNRFEYNDPFLIRFLRINQKIIRLMTKTTIIKIFPLLKYLPGDLFGLQEYGRAAKEMNKMFSDYFIQKFKDELDDTSTYNYIKAYLKEMEKRKDAGESTYLDETNLRRHIDDLFLGGSETTSSTILWSLVLAMNYPEVQKKVHNEIMDVVGTERMPNLHDKSKLNYLNAFILETQRFRTVVPLGVPHMCVATTELGGYTIPAGTFINSHLEGILTDEKTWKDPEVFRPERFLDKDNSLVIPKEFVAFSLGKRVCMGESLAKMELFLFIAAIYQRFEVCPENPAIPPAMDPVFRGTSQPKLFLVRLKRRD